MSFRLNRLPGMLNPVSKYRKNTFLSSVWASSCDKGAARSPPVSRLGFDGKMMGQRNGRNCIPHTVGSVTYMYIEDSSYR